MADVRIFVEAVLYRAKTGLPSSDQAPVRRPAAQLAAVGELQLAQHGGGVGLDRLDRDDQAAGDLQSGSGAARSTS
jgi:hypothetical protein